MSASTFQVLKVFEYLDKLAVELENKILAGAVADYKAPATQQAFEYRVAVANLANVRRVRDHLGEIFRDEAIGDESSELEPINEE